MLAEEQLETDRFQKDVPNLAEKCSNDQDISFNKTAFSTRKKLESYVLSDNNKTEVFHQPRKAG